MAGLFKWQRAARGKPDPELLICGLFAAGLLLSLLVSAAGLSLPACHFREATGWPCFSCGGTRCVASLLAGDLLAAAAWNPAIFVGCVVAGAIGLYCFAAVAFRLPRVRFCGKFDTASPIVRIGLVVGLLGNWVYLIARSG